MNTNTQEVSAAVNQNAEQREARSIILDRLVKLEPKFTQARWLVAQLESRVQTSSVFLEYIKTVYQEEKDLLTSKFVQNHLPEAEITLMKEFIGELEGFIITLKQDLRIT